MAEEGSFSGTLDTTEDGYSVTDEEGSTTNFQYDTDLSEYVGETVEVSYSGTLDDFTITDIALSDGEPVITDTEEVVTGETLPETNVFSFSIILVGMGLLLSGVFLYKTKNTDYFENINLLIFRIRDPKRYFEEKVVKESD